MTSRKKQLNMENKKKNYTAQSSKDFNDESVDEILANVDQFIEGVYRDLSISPPQRSSLSNISTFSTRRSGNDNSSFSSESNSPSGSSIFDRVSLDDSTSVVSPRTRRNMDAEIERINRICDNVDQNLRSIGLFMNNSSESNNSPDILNSNLTSSPTVSASNSLTTLSLNNSPMAAVVAPTTNRRTRPRRRSSGMRTISSSSVIDLSDSHTQTPEVIRRPPSLPLNSNINNDDDDDDVILVSANIHPVVDLCTPGGYQEAPRARTSINQRQLNRRRLNHQDEDAFGTCGTGPSPVRRRRTEHSKPNEYKKSLETSLSDTEKSCDNASGSGSGRTPFMCPVCMESCLQHQPTSTRCGHVFCKQCIEHAIRLTHKCPMCNTKISKSQLFRIYL